MPHMSTNLKKAFASDFDGTLHFARRTPSIDPAAVTAIRQFQDSGGLFGLCTGRPYRALLPLIDGLIHPNFYITSSGAVNVRKSTDYVAKCVAIAGGDYVSFDESAEDNAQSTINIQMESFYHGAVDADVLIYNSIIDGELHTLDELVALDPLMADFKAVKSGNVWCLTKNFYQESLELSDLILDVNHALNDAPDTAFHFLTRMK